ncbi:MAG: hypothetical protein CMO12_02760 [Thaumarchaeota archaeon]|nr:hypothetical protein [Nitrososphaerota archaeon]
MKQLLNPIFDFFRLGKGSEKYNANRFFYYAITTFPDGGDELICAMISTSRTFTTINESR